MRRMEKRRPLGSDQRADDATPGSAPSSIEPLALKVRSHVSKE